MEQSSYCTWEQNLQRSNEWRLNRLVYHCSYPMVTWTVVIGNPLGDVLIHNPQSRRKKKGERRSSLSTTELKNKTKNNNNQKVPTKTTNCTTKNPTIIIAEYSSTNENSVATNIKSSISLTHISKEPWAQRMKKLPSTELQNGQSPWLLNAEQE